MKAMIHSAFFAAAVFVPSIALAGKIIGNG